MSLKGEQNNSESTPPPVIYPLHYDHPKHLFNWRAGVALAGYILSIAGHPITTLTSFIFGIDNLLFEIVRVPDKSKIWILGFYVFGTPLVGLLCSVIAVVALKECEQLDLKQRYKQAKIGLAISISTLILIFPIMVLTWMSQGGH